MKADLIFICHALVCLRQLPQFFKPSTLMSQTGKQLSYQERIKRVSGLF